ncbi:hypothetical protein [Psychrobacillus sp. L4]|uniref:hypothetical protein n=1 Tax=Psychrobacillus sp. L4 TaxID=3236892 RepID=UPI0036F2CFB7
MGKSGLLIHHISGVSYKWSLTRGRLVWKNFINVLLETEFSVIFIDFKLHSSYNECRNDIMTWKSIYRKGCVVNAKFIFPREKPIISWMNPKKPTFFIHEKSPAYKKHDQLFKELISNFFEEFLEAFFPEVHQFVDFTAVKQLSEEVYTDLIDGERVD